MSGGRTFALGGRRTALEAVRAGLAVEVLVARGARGTPGLRDITQAVDAAGIAVREVDRAQLDRLASDHHGVVARVRSAPELGERSLATWAFAEDALVVVLDGVDDPQNVGAAARSAEAAGAAMLVTRTHRAAPITQSAFRASAGALLHLPHARVANIARALERLHTVDFTVVGLDEKAERSVYAEPAPQGRIAVVLGSEAEGLSRLTRETCDLLISLPMRGHVRSLNASASLAAVLFAYVVPRGPAPAGR